MWVGPQRVTGRWVVEEVGWVEPVHRSLDTPVPSQYTCRPLTPPCSRLDFKGSGCTVTGGWGQLELVETSQPTGLPLGDVPRRLQVYTVGTLPPE